MIPVVERVMEAKAKKIKAYPCRSNRASELGHPCERYLYYLRANWQDKALHSAELQFIFEAGNRIEDEAISELKEAGFLVLEQGRSFEMRDLNITGHLDLKIAERGSQTAYPVEVKGLQHGDWSKLNSIQDFFNSTKPWIKKYPTQIFLYMLMSNSEDGLFYLKSKATSRPKEVWVKLDFEYTESILKKAERVNAAIAAGAPPDRMEYDDAVCGSCPFAHICLPDQDFGKGAEILNRPDMEEWLKRREELKPLVDEFKGLDELIKDILSEKDDVIIGQYWIKGKWIERKGYTVKDSKYWQVKILPLNKGA